MRNKEIVVAESIESKILLIRGLKVLLSGDLALLYGVPHKVLMQAVKRNKERFPEDFMFQLSEGEWANLKSQIAISGSVGQSRELVTNCDQLSGIKYSPQPPHAFTEQGVAMLSGVLRSKRAIQVNVAIMRTFVKLREMLLTHKELAQQLAMLERKVEKHDHEIHAIFEVIRRLMVTPEKPKRPIGFRIGEKRAGYKPGRGEA
jgi:hypothetical protein